MEGLSLLMEEAANNNPMFAYHPKRSPLKFTHLCFANDIFPFSTASVDSIKVIKRVLDDFEGLAGLRANPAKSPQVLRNSWIFYRCRKVNFLSGILESLSYSRG